MNRYKMAILMPVNSQDLMKILKGEKTLIVSKFMPNCGFPMDVYLYCTKSGLNLYSECVEVWHYFDMGVAEPFGEFTNFNLTKEKLEVNKLIWIGELSRLFRKRLNGKVVAKFTLNSVDKITYYDEQEPNAIYNEDLGVYELDYSNCGTGYYANQTDLNKMCLTYNELEKYGKGKNLYSLQIDNLKILDNPMELSEFRTYCDGENNKCRNCSYYWYYSNESIGSEEGCYCDNLLPVKKASGNFLHVFLEED